jgi:hypothetical protein
LIHFCDPNFENKNKREKVKTCLFGKVKEIRGKEVKGLEYFNGFTHFFGDKLVFILHFNVTNSSNKCISHGELTKN